MSLLWHAVSQSIVHSTPIPLFSCCLIILCAVTPSMRCFHLKDLSHQIFTKENPSGMEVLSLLLKQRMALQESLR